MPAMNDGGRNVCSNDRVIGAEMDGRRHQVQTDNGHLHTGMTRNPRTQARASEHNGALLSCPCCNLDEVREAIGDIAQGSFIAVRIEVRVVRTFVGPAAGFGGQRQRSDFGGVGSAFETVREDAMALHVQHLPCYR